MSFFADVDFFGKHSISMTVRLFDEDYKALLERLKEKPATLMLVEPEAPNLLPNFKSRERLAELYEMIETQTTVMEMIIPESTNRHFRERSVTLWPGSWFWFDSNRNYSLHPTILTLLNYKHNK